MNIIDPDNADVRRIAIRLCRQDGRHEDHVTPLGGFSVPSWLFYVSEATKIWSRHLAANGLEWDGKKIR